MMTINSHWNYNFDINIDNTDDPINKVYGQKNTDALLATAVYEGIVGRSNKSNFSERATMQDLM